MAMDAICGYCGRTADHVVGTVTVCDYVGCTDLAERDEKRQTPLSVLLARYGKRGDR